MKKLVSKFTVLLCAAALMAGSAFAAEKPAEKAPKKECGCCEATVKAGKECTKCECCKTAAEKGKVCAKCHPGKKGGGKKKGQA